MCSGLGLPGTPGSCCWAQICASSSALQCSDRVTPLFPSLWTESLGKPGHRQQLSSAEAKFLQQTTGGPAGLPPNRAKRGFSHFSLQFSVGFIGPKCCCLSQDWIFGCFCFPASCLGAGSSSHVGSGALCLIPARYPGIPEGRRAGDEGNAGQDTHLPVPSTRPR